MQLLSCVRVLHPWRRGCRELRMIAHTCSFRIPPDGCAHDMLAHDVHIWWCVCVTERERERDATTLSLLNVSAPRAMGSKHPDATEETRQSFAGLCEADPAFPFSIPTHLLSFVFLGFSSNHLGFRSDFPVHPQVYKLWPSVNLKHISLKIGFT